MGNNASAIHNQLLVPFAGYRHFDGAAVYFLGSAAALRSSSPSSTETPYSRYLFLNVAGILNMDAGYRAIADSLRCVYDSYETYTPASSSTCPE